MSVAYQGHFVDRGPYPFAPATKRDRKADDRPHWHAASGLFGMLWGALFSLLVIVGAAQIWPGYVISLLPSQNRIDANTANSSSLDTESEPPPAPHQWTKGQFTSHIIGMTKTQVRSEFGSPDNVVDSTWYYWHLDIVDSDAGTPVRNTGITFTDPGGDPEVVSQVSFN